MRRGWALWTWVVLVLLALVGEGTAQDTTPTKKKRGRARTSETTKAGDGSASPEAGDAGGDAKATGGTPAGGTSGAAPGTPSTTSGAPGKGGAAGSGAAGAATPGAAAGGAGTGSPAAMNETKGSAQAPATPAESDPGNYAVRLRDLEQRVTTLKEQIFRSKSRLALLAETVLHGVVAGSQARIIHENRMSASYRLVKAVYSLDGAPIFNRADEEGALGQEVQFDIFNGSIVPGEHTLTVSLEYRGHGYGIFSYLKGYRFKVRSSYTFTAPEKKGVTLRVIGYEKGTPTAPIEERPAIRFSEQTWDSSRRNEAQAQPRSAK